MDNDARTEEELRAARRNFLATCGKFAVATPPAVTLLLSASGQNYATASSHGTPFRQGNNGFGNGGGDGTPGNSGFQDVTR